MQLNLLAALGMLLGAGAQQAVEPTYFLSVRIDPSTNDILVNGRLVGACLDSSAFYLNRNFRIESMADRKGALGREIDTAGTPMPFASITRPIRLQRPACEPSFRYEGRIPTAVSDVNIISSELVELSSYSGWYPESPALASFKFDVTLTMPAGYT